MARGSIRKRRLDDGSVRYDVQVDLGNDPVTAKRRQRKKTFATKKEAQTALTAWQSEIDTGTAVDHSRQTVAELLRYWLDTYARHNVRPISFESYERTIERQIIPALGSVPVQKLTPDQLQAFYSARLTAGCGPRTVQLCHARLRQALNYALKLDLVGRNVANVVTPPRVQQKEMRTWDVAQAQRFLAVARQSHFGPIWVLSLATGMRRGELLGVRWQDVEFDRNILHVRQIVAVVRGQRVIGQPKSKSSRRAIAIPGPVMDELREHRRRQNEHRRAMGTAWEDNGLVFATYEGRPINPRLLVRDYEQWIAAAGVPRIRIHDQRHTHVTLALGLGANIKAVSQRVGHARTSITMDLYAHVMPEQHIDVADRISSALFGTPVASDAGQEAICDMSAT